ASTLFERAGAAARGTYVSVDGLAIERLPKPGKAFVREFGATQAGGRGGVTAVYAAQAAQPLLGAIGRSDRTPASVASELRSAHVGDGLIGTFSIDANGDPKPAPITIVRLERGGGTDVLQSSDGARVDRVITPPRSLYGPTG